MKIEFLTIGTNSRNVYDSKEIEGEAINELRKDLINKIKAGETLLPFPKSELYGIKFSVENTALIGTIFTQKGNNLILTFAIAKTNQDLDAFWSEITSADLNAGEDCSHIQKPNVPCIVAAIHEGAIYALKDLPLFGSFERYFAAAWLIS